MGFEIYAERPLAESIACATVSAGVAATVACFGARTLMSFMSEHKGQRELGPWATLVVAAGAYVTSWLIDESMRKAFMKNRP